MLKAERNSYDSPTFGESLLLRVDLAIGAMSLSPNGRDAVLAGRRGLFVIDLDDPFTTPRWLHHITSWEVADVQWSPHHFAKPSWCISTSNQKALLWDLERVSNNAIINVLHEHMRAITDINFHPSDPEVLATCSIDTFIYSWDMRTPRKPVAKWAEWRAGATQVKWNHDNPFEIASSHDHSFYIWDSRKGSLPILKVNRAHEGKINGLDFSNGSTSLITCSNDCSVKLWNLKSDAGNLAIDSFDYYNLKDHEESTLKPSVVINTDYPVARARSVPFGQDKACGIMPLRGGDNSIHIVNYDQAFQSSITEEKVQFLNTDNSYVFEGHEGHMKDFLWRTKHESYEGFDLKNKWKDYQLVSWSSEKNDLKLWQLDLELYKTVNYDPTFVDVFKELDQEKVIQSETKVMHSYKSYCTEPPVTIDDLSRNTNGDILSSLALLKIAEKHKAKLFNTNQINHLDWISGVRLGRTNQFPQRKFNGFENIDEPSNLGEEVSIVGHKFPKVRFERISVSTGKLVVSLRALVDYTSTAIDSTAISSSKNKPDNSTSEIEDLTENVSEIESEKDHSTAQFSTAKPLISSVNGIINSNPNTLHASSGHVLAALTPLTSLAAPTKSTKSDREIDNHEAQSAEILTESTMIFVRMQINFPENYPYLDDVETSNLPAKRLAKLQKANQIHFEIEETYELTSDMKFELLSNLNKIANFYTNKHQRFCLEPCLRFLMGDKIDLDANTMVESQVDKALDTVIEVGNEGWADEFIIQQPGLKFDFDRNVSGEEDNEGDLIPTMLESDVKEKDKSSQIPGDHLITSPKKRAFSKDPTPFDSTPIPKGCGGRWSANGQLVCFFLPNNCAVEDSSKPPRIMSTDSSAKFKIHANDPNSDCESNEKADLESKLSDLSNVESSSSDDDESFSQDWEDMLKNDIPERIRTPGLFRTSVGLRNKFAEENSNRNSLIKFGSHGGTGSNYKSSIQDGTRKKRSYVFREDRNIVILFDLTHLIPDKYELACEYRILGDAPENLACHNAAVALKYGLNESYEIWKILELMLIKDLVIEHDDHFYRDDWEQEFHGFDFSSKSKDSSRNHRFFWGNHPFGHAWVIGEIFKYYENKRDCQMLAMLACILHENPKILSSNAENFAVPVHTPYKVLPPLPSVSVRSKFNETLLSYGLIDSPHGKEHNDVQRLKQSAQTVSTPHLLVHPIRNGFDRAESFNESLGSSLGSNLSPERYGFGKKNMQHLHTNSPFHGPSDSPHYLRSKLTMLRQNSSDTKRNIKKKTIKYPNKTKFRPAPVISIEMQNVDLLDIYEDVYTRGLLSSQDPKKLEMYREQYANMLYLWKLANNRIKVLKFNHVDLDGREKESEYGSHHCKVALRSRSKQNPKHPFVNTISTMQSTPNSWNTMKRITFKYCILCQTRVTKNFIVCQLCEHVMHTSCASEWWSDIDNEECPSGCSCKCLYE